MPGVYVLFPSITLLAVCYRIAGNVFSQGHVQELLVGKQLQHSLLQIIVDVDIFECIEQCSRRKRCLSVNYFRSFLYCELNAEDRSGTNVVLADEYSSVYTEKVFWQKNHNDPCSNHVCREDQVCQLDTTGRAECVLSDCGFPTTPPNAEVASSMGIGIYSKVTYRCRQGTVLVGKPFIGCQRNGKWSIVRFVCACKDNWRLFGESCYRYYRLSKGWENARNHCMDEGAYLVEVTSEAEDQFLNQLTGGTDSVWIGGQMSMGKWRWANSHDPISWSNWEPGQPFLENENCIAYFNMIPWQGKWTWHDVSCGVNLYFICEK